MQLNGKFQRQFAVSCAALSLCLALPAQAVKFPSAGDRGAPARTTGGGTRGEQCEDIGAQAEWPLRALVPANNVSTFSAKQATLWFQLEESLSGKAAEIYIKDRASNETVYEQRLAISALDSEGLFKVALPETDASGALLLATDREYYWEFSVICDANNRARDYALQGWMQRVGVEDELANAIAPTQQQAERYAAAGLWQETLEAALALKPAQPLLWAELLLSVGLSE